jgi:hypothetical protein
MKRKCGAATPTGTVTWVHIHPFANADKDPSCPPAWEGMPESMRPPFDGEVDDEDARATVSFGLQDRWSIDQDKSSQFAFDPTGGNNGFFYRMLQVFGRCGS